MVTKAEIRKRFRDGEAEQLAHALAPDARPVSRRGLSTYFAYYETEDAFLVVASGHRSLAGDAHRALALGVGYAAGKSLVLVLPWGLTEPTLLRASCFSTPISVFEHRRGVVVAALVPTAADAVRQAGAWGGVTTTEQEKPAHAFARGADWVIDLMDWVMTRRVETVSRKSYLAWHFRGRQVLKLKRTGPGFQVDAGVQYKKPLANQPQPISRQFGLDAPPTEQTLQQIKEAVDRAIENRRRGLDSGHQEHALQESIRHLPDRFGLVRWTREFPAARPGSRRAFIDYIGVDENDVLHVVETKVGPDPMLVLQGIDYWLWTSANEEEIARQFGVGRFAGTTLDFVLGEAEGKALLHSLTPAQLRSVTRKIAWRVHTVAGWKGGKKPAVRSWPKGELP